MLSERKDSFIEEVRGPGEKVDSCRKEPTPHSPCFAWRFYRKKRKRRWGLRDGKDEVRGPVAMDGTYLIQIPKKAV